MRCRESNGHRRHQPRKPDAPHSRRAWSGLAISSCLDFLFLHRRSPSLTTSNFLPFRRSIILLLAFGASNLRSSFSVVVCNLAALMTLSFALAPSNSLFNVRKRVVNRRYLVFGAMSKTKRNATRKITVCHRRRRRRRRKVDCQIKRHQRSLGCRVSVAHDCGL